MFPAGKVMRCARDLSISELGARPANHASACRGSQTRNRQAMHAWGKCVPGARRPGATPPQQRSLGSSITSGKCPSVTLGCMDRLRLFDDVYANEDHPTRAPVLGPVGDVT